jgi:hypothetical protein
MRAGDWDRRRALRGPGHGRASRARER